LVAAHGSLAEGLVSAVQSITGHGGVLMAMSNAGMSSADVATAMARALDATGATVVFTDLPAGSCTLAARRLQRDRPGLSVVIGVNLPMLLEFALQDPGSVTTGGNTSAGALGAAVDRGRDHIRIFGATGGP
jgi:mannose/fructose-specific phosphotransferase system component IIA